MAPLTGIAFASNWLISKLNLNYRSVKTTRMTTINVHGCVHMNNITIAGNSKHLKLSTLNTTYTILNIQKIND
ncbi:hypothetical protein AN688_0221885 [Citrobacter freundii]|nr:hypothetical protein AN688_0221885 [Citrobacter freundii]